MKTELQDAPLPEISMEINKLITALHVSAENMALIDQHLIDFPIVCKAFDSARAALVSALRAALDAKDAKITQLRVAVETALKQIEVDILYQGPPFPKHTKELHTMLQTALESKAVLTVKAGTCRWKYKQNIELWKTACGNVYDLPEGASFVDYKFCPFCGKPIEEAADAEN